MKNHQMNRISSWYVCAMLQFRELIPILYYKKSVYCVRECYSRSAPNPSLFSFIDLTFYGINLFWNYFLVDFLNCKRRLGGIMTKVKWIQLVNEYHVLKYFDQGWFNFNSTGQKSFSDKNKLTTLNLLKVLRRGSNGVRSLFSLCNKLCSANCVIVAALQEHRRNISISRNLMSLKCSKFNDEFALFDVHNWMKKG